MKMNGNSTGPNAAVTKADMEKMMANASAGPVQTIRIEQAPLKITTDTTSQESYKL